MLSLPSKLNILLEQKKKSERCRVPLKENIWGRKYQTGELMPAFKGNIWRRSKNKDRKVASFYPMEHESERERKTKGSMCVSLKVEK